MKNSGSSTVKRYPKCKNDSCNHLVLDKDAIYCKHCISSKQHKSKIKQQYENIVIKQLKEYLQLEFPFGADFKNTIGLKMVEISRCNKKKVAIKGISKDLARRCGLKNNNDITADKVTQALIKLQTEKPHQYDAVLTFCRRLWVEVREQDISLLQKLPCELIEKYEPFESTMIKKYYMILTPHDCTKKGCKSYKKSYDGFTQACKYIAKELKLIGQREEVINKVG